MTVLTLDPAADGRSTFDELWEWFLRSRRPREFQYLFAFGSEADAPAELRSPFVEKAGIRTWRPVGRAIDDLHLPASAFVVAASVMHRRPPWDALPDCILLSVLRDNDLEPELVFFRLDEWKRSRAAGGEAA